MDEQETMRETMGPGESDFRWQLMKPQRTPVFKEKKSSLLGKKGQSQTLNITSSEMPALQRDGTEPDDFWTISENIMRTKFISS